MEVQREADNHPDDNTGGKHEPQVQRGWYRARRGSQHKAQIYSEFTSLPTRVVLSIDEKCDVVLYIFHAFSAFALFPCETVWFISLHSSFKSSLWIDLSDDGRSPNQLLFVAFMAFPMANFCFKSTPQSFIRIMCRQGGRRALMPGSRLSSAWRTETEKWTQTSPRLKCTRSMRITVVYSNITWVTKELNDMITLSLWDFQYWNIKCQS